MSGTAAIETQALLDFLGGRKTLGLGPRAQADFVGLVRHGLPYQALRAVTDSLLLSLKDLQGTLQLSPRSLQRRKTARLSPLESERILRLARVAVHATQVLGDRAAALDWLSTPNRALSGEQPIHLLDTDVGTNEVMEVLDRILYGVYS
ncbi:MAG TPA: antitoxin Xre/MbcA/ParS toxin-binding domain-containing protein [Anaeromyxobacteraceae bacterium]|nr:antitoxin Xre/MbcA/ParS toxin-binding domain-containing protein [Anaeromyxobacteraceae bacterium]